jgi:hypothetical protein
VLAWENKTGGFSATALSNSLSETLISGLNCIDLDNDDAEGDENFIFSRIISSREE